MRCDLARPPRGHLVINYAVGLLLGIQSIPRAHSQPIMKNIASHICRFIIIEESTTRHDVNIRIYRSRRVNWRTNKPSPSFVRNKTVKKCSETNSSNYCRNVKKLQRRFNFFVLQLTQPISIDSNIHLFIFEISEAWNHQDPIFRYFLQIQRQMFFFHQVLFVLYASSDKLECLFWKRSFILR